MNHASTPIGLDRLFRPASVAVVGASAHDPARQGTRTLFDLLDNGWAGHIYPVSSRHESLYDLPVYRSLRDLPQAPDVVVARVPSAAVPSVVDDAIHIGAKFLITLASGFAENGEAGAQAQAALVNKARSGGLRIVGPQSIGLVNCMDGLSLSLSQIGERFVIRPGRTALLTQSGAIAISLAIRGQEDVGLDFSYIATFGNSADVTQTEALAWLADDAHTDAIGLYIEGFADASAFARAVTACRRAGKTVVLLRSGLSARGAQAVATHTASMSGDADTFRAFCKQLGVVLCDSAEQFLWALKAANRPTPPGAPKVLLTSVSGGACALWADHADRLGFELPQLGGAAKDGLVEVLPDYMNPGNPLDLGPSMFDDRIFDLGMRSLAAGETFNWLVIYIFTSSPTLMGGLQKIRHMERIARDHADKPLWVVWEAPTAEEWAALARSDALLAFRDLGQAAETLALLSAARTTPVLEANAILAPRLVYDARVSKTLRTEPEVKNWLRSLGIQTPQGEVFKDVEPARAYAEKLGGGVVLKVVSGEIPHKSEVGGVSVCAAGASVVVERFARLLASVDRLAPGIQYDGVLVEAMVDEPGIELFVTVRNDPLYGLVTIVGRGGVEIEVERDYAIHVGRLAVGSLPAVLGRLRSAPLFGAFRGRGPLAVGKLEGLIQRLQQGVEQTGYGEVELNPVRLTPDGAWVLDGLMR